MTALNDTRAGTADSMVITGSGQARSLAKPRTPGRIRLRVRASEVDPYNIAHHSNYSVWAELALQEYLRSVTGDTLPSYRILRCQCKYMLSARYDDLVEAAVFPAGRSSAGEVFRFQITDCVRHQTFAAGRIETAFP